MRVCIHRGAKQIGGTCVEIEAEGKRILLDLGIPLDADEPSKELLPSVKGLSENDDSLLGIIISHPHQDHYGLVHMAQSGIPIVMGEAASRIILAASQFFFRGYAPSNTLGLKDKQPLSLGPFTITPYLVDHSAYDAYSILVEANGKRLFYSGDFRGHGRKAALFDRFMANPPENIDVLLMEGSTIGRIEPDEKFPTETELEHQFVQGFNKTIGLAMVYASSQNIDRIVTIYRACKKSNRALVIDLYIAANLINYIKKFSNHAREIIEHFGFEDHIAKLDKANRLYLVVSKFCEIDLHPDKVSNIEMGYIFEELIRKFNEASNEEAGDHFTPREVIRLTPTVRKDVA